MRPRNYAVNFRNFVRQYLPAHKRQPVRLALLRAMVHLKGVFDDFAVWRDDYRYKIAVNSQVRVLQGHLRKVFGADIVVRSFAEQYLEIGLLVEPAHWRSFGLDGEDVFIPVALQGENEALFGDVDFIVFTPAGVDLALLRAEIEQYKLADKDYKIIVI